MFKKVEDVFYKMRDKVTHAPITPDFVLFSYENAEEYEVICGEDGKITFKAARLRSAFYAVYHYFEKAYGVSYHWDGDIYPQQKQGYIKTSIHTAPRFEYRGIRYFAHRGLHRFQAEMWDIKDWEKELDWLLKKRFNMFMLRIGGEDIFPLAFPDICPFDYSDGGNPERKGFDDRTPMSTLKKSFEIRKAVCRMARERDLIQPVDCGTMTHWYSRTPKCFLEKEKPSFLSQTTSVYSDKGGLVWDIREDKNLENYFKLTKAYTENLGCDGVFHTIGLAERLFSADREENLKLKKYTYSRICEFLNKNYPNSKLLVASWDFSFYWQNEEVGALLDELDREKCIIFDYTSDTTDQTTNFLNWGVKGHFPYIFGIFHAFEPSNGIRGNYETIKARMDIAAQDKYCKGFVTWQELSHGDNFMLEYTAANAWQPIYSRENLLPEYCKKRFGSLTDEFESIYNTLYPVTRLFVWGGDKAKPEQNFFNDYTYDIISTSITRTPIKGELKEDYKNALIYQLAEYEGVKENTFAAKAMLLKIKPLLYTSQQKREWYDLMRSCLSAQTHFEIIKCGLAIDSGIKNGDILPALQYLKNVLSYQRELASVLKEHEDYSLAATLKRLKESFTLNPYFENITIKENTVTEYCRTCIYEVFERVTVPETEAVMAWLNRIEQGKADGKQYDCTLLADLKQITEEYLKN